MNFKKLVFVLSISLFLISCGDSSTSQNKKVSVTASPKNTSPCKLISVEEIKSICNVDSKFQISQSDKILTYPTCTFKWEDKQVNRVMSVGGNEITVDMPSEVTVVMVSDATEKMFEQSIVVYKDGVDVSLGEKAIWGTEMSQLTFLSNGYLFHVHLKVSNDDSGNKQKALKVADLLIERI